MWAGKKEIVLDHALETTKSITLFVISAAGFGRRTAWKDELKAPSGHFLTFKDALVTASTGMPIKLVVPEAAGAISSRVRKLHEAYDELGRYMVETIERRKNATDHEQCFDLLSNLLCANEVEDGNAKLTDAEVLGNVFIFLVAGHESTAHTISFALGLLALYQDEQERLYQEILKATPDNRDPTFQDLSALSYVQCVLNETLRMFPPVDNILKEAAEDCTLTTTNNAGETVTVAIPKGSGISLRIAGLHYNPKYWKDPLTFNPARFSGDWPREAFLPFSGGSRSCIGRRFAELEFMAAITMFVKNYKIFVKQEPQFARETFQQRKERVMSVTNGLTLTPAKMPLTFVRRD